MGHRTDKTRTEDMATDQRAHRHSTKSADYTEDAQNVRDDNVSPGFQPLNEEDTAHARNKAAEGKDNEQ